MAVDHERRHEPDSSGVWCEHFAFDFTSPSGMGGSFHLGFRPELGTAWCRADLVLTDGRPIVVRDDEIALPRSGALTVRSDGLWAEMICETPMEHWSLGLEAFGVLLDDPLDAYSGEIGERTPLGLDLEWEGFTTPWWGGTDHASGGDEQAGRYEHTGVVHGEILMESETVEFDGSGERVHHWGTERARAAGWHRGSLQVGDALALAFECDASGGASGFLWRAGDELSDIERVLVESHRDANGLPTAARYVVDGRFELDVEVLGLAPVLLADGSRLARALCRYESSEGEGTGWSEWLD